MVDILTSQFSISSLYSVSLTFLTYQIRAAHSVVEGSMKFASIRNCNSRGTFLSMLGYSNILSVQ